jgi:hypothetical protein
MVLIPLGVMVRGMVTVAVAVTVEDHPAVT